MRGESGILVDKMRSGRLFALEKLLLRRMTGVDPQPPTPLMAAVNCGTARGAAFQTPAHLQARNHLVQQVR